MQGLIVDRNHLLLESGKLVLQKKIKKLGADSKTRAIGKDVVQLTYERRIVEERSLM